MAISHAQNYKIRAFRWLSPNLQIIRACHNKKRAYLLKMDLCAIAEYGQTSEKKRISQ